MHVDLVMSFIARRDKIREVKTCVVAYRLSKMTNQSQQSMNSQDPNSLMEGYDDGNEEGCGEKLLAQLQKMGVENILIVVYIWH